MWLSTNNGANWLDAKMGSFNVRAVGVWDRGVGITPYIYAGTARTGTALAKLYRTTNEGGSWSQITSYPPTNVTVVTAIRVRTDNNYIFVASDVGLHRTTDDGVPWSNLPMPNGDNNILSLTIARDNQSIVYTGTAKAVYTSTDGGSNWSEVSTGLGRMPLQSVAASSTNAWTVSKRSEERRVGKECRL